MNIFPLRQKHNPLSDIDETLEGLDFLKGQIVDWSYIQKQLASTDHAEKVNDFFAFLIATEQALQQRLTDLKKQ